MADELKAGMKVRATRDFADITKDREYEIIQVDPDDEDMPIRVRDNVGDGWWLKAVDFEPAEQAEPKFKKGDRVRLTKDNMGFGEAGDTGTMLNDFDYVRLDRRVNGGTDWYVTPTDMELIGVVPSATEGNELAPATLQLEAGKFYRTRDGRKVGPISKMDFGDGYPFEVGAGWWVSPSGEAQAGSVGPDLIAEWVDEPQEDEPVAAATQPKFKVGDVVKFRDNYPSWAAGEKATVIGINVWGDDGIQVEMDDGSISTEEQSDLVPATATNTPTPTTGFTVPLCAYEDAVTTTALGDAYVAGYKAGLAAQQAAAQQAAA